jgi:prolycopene isomerase
MNEQTIEQKISESYDVVVVGAGNGGLAAAAILAKNGVKVLLLEQHNLPGGFATSFVRGRFEFEPSLHELASYGPPDNKGGIRRMFEDELNLDVEFLEVPEAYRLIDPSEGIDVSMPFGVENFIEAMEKEVPGSRDSVRKFFDICVDLNHAFAYIGKSKGKPDQAVLLREHSNFLKTAAYSVDEVEDALNIPKKAQRILNAYWAYLGLPTSRINFTLFAAMLNSYMTRGGWIPKHRSHEFATAFDAKIREFGGKIEYNSRAEKILVEYGKVVGVETSKGDKIKTNHVISNASPILVYNKLIYPKSEVPEIAYREINARTHGLTCFVVYMALDAPAEEVGLKDYGYFLMNGSSDEIYESWSELKKPEGQASLCLNNALPDCSPPGTCLVSITTLFRPEAWKDVKPEEYFKLKSKLAGELISDLEKATGASIKEHIEEIEIATPQTFARYTKTHNGIIYGYEPESWDSIMPRMMCMNDEKHIEGLEFASGFGRMAHGYSSALEEGNLAAMLTLQELKKSKGDKNG